MGAPPLTIETAEASFLAAPGPATQLAMLPETGSTGATVASTAQRRLQLPPAMPTHFIAIPVAAPEFTAPGERSKRGRVYGPPGMRVIPPLEKPIRRAGCCRRCSSQCRAFRPVRLGSRLPHAPASSGTEPQAASASSRAMAERDPERRASAGHVPIAPLAGADGDVPGDRPGARGGARPAAARRFHGQPGGQRCDPRHPARRHRLHFPPGAGCSTRRSTGSRASANASPTAT